MRKEYVFKSNTKSTVVIENDIIRISRKGAFNFVLQGLKGEKSIPIRSITAVQLKKPGVTTGYIQFAQHGMIESGGGVSEAISDENTVLFGKKDYKKAVEIKEFIESRQAEINSSTGTVIQQKSEADELLKFKELLDEGIINEEEFESKKKQILGL